MNDWERVFLLLILLVASVSMEGQQERLMEHPDIQYEDCEGYQDSVYGNAASIARFEKVVLGMSLEEVKRLEAEEQESLFSTLYARSNVIENFEHPHGQYKIFPFEPICPLFNRFISAQRSRVLVEDYWKATLPIDFDSTGFNLAINAVSHWDCRQFLLIKEVVGDSAIYEFTEGRFLGPRETQKGGIQGWNKIKSALEEIDFIALGHFKEQYHIRQMYPDGDWYSVRIKYKGKVAYFSYFNLSIDDQLLPALVLRQLIAVINASFEFSM